MSPNLCLAVEIGLGRAVEVGEYPEIVEVESFTQSRDRRVGFAGWSIGDSAEWWVITNGVGISHSDGTKER